MQFHSKKNSAVLLIPPRRVRTLIVARNSESKVRSAERLANTEFLMAVTHELKSPLSAILGFADILKNDLQDHNSSRESAGYIEDIKEVALNMSELVNDLLDMNQVNSGNFSINMSEEIEIVDVITRVIKLNRHYSVRRGVQLKNEVAANIDPIKLDVKRMKQILNNLISNAVKYSPKHSVTVVSARNMEENNQKLLEIRISDQGFGIAPSQATTAFHKYKTIPNPNSGKIDSCGLGLSITKQLVELQNGSLEVMSGLGSGTEIILKFPYA